MVHERADKRADKRNVGSTSEDFDPEDLPAGGKFKFGQFGSKKPGKKKRKLRQFKLETVAETPNNLVRDRRRGPILEREEELRLVRLAKEDDARTDRKPLPERDANVVGRRAKDKLALFFLCKCLSVTNYRGFRHLPFDERLSMALLGFSVGLRKFSPADYANGLDAYTRHWILKAVQILGNSYRRFIPHPRRPSYGFEHFSIDRPMSFWPQQYPIVSYSEPTGIGREQDRERDLYASLRRNNPEEIFATKEAYHQKFDHRSCVEIAERFNVDPEAVLAERREWRAWRGVDRGPHRHRTTKVPSANDAPVAFKSAVADRYRDTPLKCETLTDAVDADYAKKHHSAPMVDVIIPRATGPLRMPTGQEPVASASYWNNCGRNSSGLSRTLRSMWTLNLTSAEVRVKEEDKIRFVEQFDSRSVVKQKGGHNPSDDDFIEAIVARQAIITEVPLNDQRRE